MAKLIKSAPAKATVDLMVGSNVFWYTRFHDGRTYESTVHYGTVTKLNPVNVRVTDNNGAIWSVGRNELNVLKFKV